MPGSTTMVTSRIYRPVARSGFGGGGLYGKKWTFAHVFWEKVDLLVSISRESQLLCAVTAGQGHVPWEIFERLIENYAFIDIMI